jgi:hypothetical protein
MAFMDWIAFMDETPLKLRFSRRGYCPAAIPD